MPQTAALPLEAAVAQGSRYEVGEVLATGGMGTVHRGFDGLAQRPVAYKRLKAVNESARSRVAALFQREYDTLTHLTHPNIVEVYDFGFDASGPYYTMELLSGDDLAKLAPLSVRDTCRVLRDVASALALLHARHLVHRDVSPNNVRLTADGRAKLIDFGGLTEFGVPTEIVGTPAFIPPECLDGAPLDQRTDLYALGALAYWTLTRRLHLRARTLEELLEAWEHEVLPPSHYVPAIPKELDELVLSLLQHEPLARPDSATAVIERLTTIAALPPEQDEQRVAFSYLQHAPLRGREQQLAVLVHALRAAVSGTGQVVLLEAEQGLGRSALLHQLSVEAQLAGATVLRAQGGMHITPFSAARHVVHTGFGIFPDLAQRVRDRSSQFFRITEREEKGPRSTIDAAERQTMVASLLQEAILQLSLRTPLVLLIDDAHSVDAESLSLFASLLESLRGYPILMVLSMQANQSAQSLDAQAKLEATAKRCKLTPLCERHLRDLVTAMFGGVPNSQHMAGWLYEQTGGNPAHCLDLARLLLSQGAIRYTVGTFTLPHEFSSTAGAQLHSQALLASIAGLPAHARDVAFMLGIHHGPLSNEELSAATSLNARELLLAVEQLVQRGVVVADSDRVSCSSAAFYGALASSRSEAEQREAHLTLARAFAEQRVESLESQLATARHLLWAGEERAFEGASLLAGIADEHKFQLASIRANLQLLESALAVLEARGLPDQECLGLLIPLTLAGFYGQLELQQRYLTRTMSALAQLCGITLAQRLSRFLGGKLGLLFGILFGVAVFACTRRTVNRRSMMQHFEAFGGLPGSATAAAACAWDVPEAYRIVRWLDPFAAASERSSFYLMREFCLATAELVSVKLQSASERYSRLFEFFQGKVLGLDEIHLEQFRCGCLHGKAQALVTNAAPEALVVADELERRGAFFAPHAAGVRMTYHMYRGEAHKALPHRQRAEALALRGGTSWSAISVLTIRMVHGCVMTGDVVGLVHVVADLERLAKLAPSLAAIHELAQAHLELMRGHPERALAVYERVLETENARALPSYPVERAMQVQALSLLGRHEAARTLCLALMEEIEQSGRDSDHIVMMTRQRLARAEAGLGNFGRAAELIDSCFERAKLFDNPLTLGILHRERAYVAVMAGDSETFELHLQAMSERFAATENPWLIQQYDALRTQGVRGGVRRASMPDGRAIDDLDGATALKTAVEQARASEAATLERSGTRLGTGTGKS